MNFQRTVAVALVLLFLFSILPRKTFGSGIIDTKSISETQVASSSIPDGIDLDVLYISREPRYEWDALKKWPDPGELVTFTAYVINKGTLASGNFDFQWKIDDQTVFIGDSGDISPNEEISFALDWSWRSGKHYITFEVDPQDQIPETVETNNAITNTTDALTIPGFNCQVQQRMND